jgi:hypothetical protein
LRCVVENEDQRPSLRNTGDGKLHRMTSGHDHTNSLFPVGLPSGVSKQVSPPSVYQASGPRCRCRRVSIRIHNRFHVLRDVFCIRVYRSGPISVMCSPPFGRHSASAIVNNHTFPSA